MAIQLLISDLDGTLIDSVQVSYAIDREIIEERGGKVPSIDEWRLDMGEMEWGDLYTKYGARAADINDVVREYYIRFRQSVSPLIPRATNVLERLIKMSMPLSTVSIDDSLDSVRYKVKKSGLEGFFPIETISWAEFDKAEAIARECERRNVDPRYVAYVGDTALDIRSSRKAGVIPIVVSNRHSYNSWKTIKKQDPPYVLRDIRFLPDVLGGIK